MNLPEQSGGFSAEDNRRLWAATERRLRQMAFALMPYLPEDEREACTVLRRAKDLVRWRNRTIDEGDFP